MFVFYCGGSGLGMYGINGGRFGSGGFGGCDREVSWFGFYWEFIFFGMVVVNFFGVLFMVKISIEVFLVGVIIGKGGINVK